MFGLKKKKKKRVKKTVSERNINSLVTLESELNRRTLLMLEASELLDSKRLTKIREYVK